MMILAIHFSAKSTQETNKNLHGSSRFQDDRFFVMVGDRQDKTDFSSSYIWDGDEMLTVIVKEKGVESRTQTKIREN